MSKNVLVTKRVANFLEREREGVLLSKNIVMNRLSSVSDWKT